MPARLLILVLAALLAVVPAACGDEEQDVNAILEETFSGDKQVDSGQLALSIAVDIEGGEQVQGPLSIELAGPFQRRGEDELPSFDLDATLRGAGMTYEAGAVSTGDAGFVRFQGQAYELSEEVFDQFRAGFEQAREEQQGEEASEADLATLGIDPTKWLTNAQVTGDAKVGEADTTHITGDVDVPKLLDDLAEAGAKARELDPDNRAELPSELTEEQRTQIEQAVQDMRVEIFTGEEDRILRRIVLTADVRAPEGTEDFETASLEFDYAITELNEDQEVTAPESPQPFEELASQLQGLGLGGASGESEPNARDLERYTECVKRADNDSAAVQECADLL